MSTREKTFAITKALLATVMTSLIFVSSASVEAAYPEKNITIVVPRSPGGGLDLLSRLIAPEWSKKLGVEIVVENIPGAGGAIGLAKAYRQPADGYTIVVWSPPGEFILELQEKLQFSVADFEMIGATNSDPGAVVVPMTSPFKSVNDILDASKARRLAVGTVGRTTIGALGAMHYQEQFGANWGMVPFDGGGDVATAVMGGHVDFATREGGFYELHGNKVRILAFAATKRIEELPDVPTLEEVTGKKVLHAAYRGFAIKKGTPPEILELLRKTFNEVGQSPTIAQNQYQKTKFRYEFLDAQAFAEAQQMQIDVATRFKDRILGK